VGLWGGGGGGGGGGTNLDSDDSLAADFLHGVGNDGADLHVSVS